MFINSESKNSGLKNLTNTFLSCLNWIQTPQHKVQNLTFLFYNVSQIRMPNYETWTLIQLANKNVLYIVNIIL